MEKNYKKVIISILVIMLLFIFVIALFLKLNYKNVKTKKNNSLIYFENLRIDDNNKGNSNIVDDTTLRINTSLTETDSCTYSVSVTAVSNAYRNAYISNIELLGKDNITEKLNYEIKYVNGEKVNIGDKINPKTTITYKIIINSGENKCTDNVYKNIDVSVKFEYEFGDYKELNKNDNNQNSQLINKKISLDDYSKEKILNNYINSSSTDLQEEKQNDEIISAKYNIKKKNDDIICNENETFDSANNECICNEGYERKNNKCVKQQKNDKKNYTLKFTSINGTVNESELNVLEDESISIESLPNDGYVYSDIICTNNQKATYDNGQINIEHVTDNSECEISYVSQIYKLTIDPNGGSYKNDTSNAELDIAYKSKLDIEEPTKTGYKFKGWEITGEGTVLEENVLTMGYDTNLKAIWEIETFDVIVNALNGQSISKKVNYGEKLDINILINDGYIYDEKGGSELVCDINNVTYNKSTSTVSFDDITEDVSCEINFVAMPKIAPVNVQNDYKYTYGDKYSIIVNNDTNERHDFYVLSTDTDTVTLIMGENYTTKGTTSIFGTSRTPTTVMKLMPTVTDWNAIPSPGKFTDTTGYNDVTVDYSAYAARIPTAGEISSSCKAGTCESWIKGSYWTTSPYYNSSSTMNMYYMNGSSMSYKSYSKAGGIRPVIVLPKSYFSNYIDESNIPSNIVDAISIKSNSKYTNGDKYSILVNDETNEKHDFYVLSSDKNTVTLIMSENYTAKGTTSNFGTNRTPTTIMKLMPTVADWNTILSPETFIDDTGYGSVETDYSAYAARIPTYGDLLSVCGTGTCANWIRGSYWTTSPYYSSTSSMNLYYMNNTSISSKSYSTAGGLRPVIVLSKSYFKGIIDETVKTNIVTSINKKNNYSYTVGDKYNVVVNQKTNENHDFYVLSSDKNTVTLIMSENYTDKGSESIYGNSQSPKNILNLLPTVSDWEDIPTPGKFIDNTGYNNITVNYNSYAARIPTYGDLLAACSSGTCESWIKGSYWTTSPYYSSTSTMNMYYMNNASISNRSYSKTGGMRPVIVLPKSYFDGIIDENDTPSIVQSVTLKNTYSYSMGDKYSILVNDETNEKHDFYVLSSDTDTVTLIMSENYTENGATSNYGTSRTPTTILKLLPSGEDWNTIPSPGIFTDVNTTSNVTINYNSYAARIPTYLEINGVCTNGCKSWIKGSYWTSTPYYSSTSTMNLYYMNNVSISSKSYSTAGGLRPVIVLPKSYFK